MEHSPPPFFKRGPAPLVRLFFFASLSLALLVIFALGLAATAGKLTSVARKLARIAGRRPGGVFPEKFERPVVDFMLLLPLKARRSWFAG